MRYIMPGRGARIESGSVAALHTQFEGQVLALVTRDLAAVDPAAGEGTVAELVARVWELAARHAASAARTTWDHLAWFVDHALATRAAGLQTAGC
ncbi:hypothetical protein [Kitasatospora sp. MY 5-36]|uniref:hypothetical protein n=1 Tax=Kitasatospora sp. MY 5-36 TaxID=1678027 RepID=UPI000670F39F|nr:hypothetical protein [Kitasatospora sp. MY 5-36]